MEFDNTRRPSMTRPSGALTSVQRGEAELIAAARTQIAAELGARQSGDQRSVEQRAAQVGLGFLHNLLYRYESSAGTHATLFAVDLIFERTAKRLLLRGEPTAQFAVPPVYLHGAYLLHEALAESGKHTPALRLPELAPLDGDLRALAERHTNAHLPDWPELLPSEGFDRA